MDTKPLSKRQTQLLRLIAAYQKRDKPPFLSELARVMGLAGESSVRAVLNYLIRDGYVVRRSMGPGLPSVPTLTPLGRQEAGYTGTGLPAYGMIPGGDFQLENPQPVRYLDRLSDVFDYQDGDYALLVKGPSMTGDCIPDGATVWLRPSTAPRNGQVVHAEYRRDDGRHEVTLKRFYLDKRRGTVTLKASNPKYPDIVCRARDVEVRGVLRGVMHAV